MVVFAVDGTLYNQRKVRLGMAGLRRLLVLARVDAGNSTMIGDRAERGGEMANRAEVRCYPSGSKPVEGWTCFDACGEIAAGLAE